MTKALLILVSAVTLVACSDGGRSSGTNAAAGGGGVGGTGSGLPASCSGVPADYLPLKTIQSESPGLGGRSIVGRWMEGTGSTLEVVVSSTSLHDLVQLQTTGAAYIYTFSPDGAYSLTYVAEVTSSTCQGAAAANEHGSYAFDGSSLTLTPAGYDATFSVCGDSEPKSGIGSPRTLQVSSAVFEEPFGSPPKSAPGMVLRGPCAEYFVESSCASGSLENRLQNACAGGSTQSGGSGVGAACSSGAPCGSGLQCATDVAGGYCTAECSEDSQCAGGACVQIDSGGAACLATCNAPGACPRPADSCVDAGGFGVCVPSG